MAWGSTVGLVNEGQLLTIGLGGAQSTGSSGATPRDKELNDEPMAIMAALLPSKDSRKQYVLCNGKGLELSLLVCIMHWESFVPVLDTALLSLAHLSTRARPRSVSSQ